MNSIPKEKVIAAYQSAPEVVREAFNSEVTSQIILDMKTTHRLHVDVAGTLASEVGYLLLGLRSPAEFFGNLMLSGTDEQTARSIMEEVNNRIFIPLRNQVRSKSSSELVQPYTAQEPAPRPIQQPLAPTPTIEYTPPAPVTLPGSPEPAPMPVPPVSVSAPEPVQNTAPIQDFSAPIPLQKPEPQNPIRKDYGADPYREPI